MSDVTTRLTPLVGVMLTGATLSENDDLTCGAGRLGHPVWSPGALLANLELRLGLPQPDVTDAVRVQAWSRRLSEVQVSRPRFYTESYGVDPLGTAAALLAMRDELVGAGWNGEIIASVGERLETFAELEANASVPPGTFDRLRRVEEELGRVPLRPFDGLRLAETVAVWPARWRRVFARLEALGVPARPVPVTFPTNAGTDLARVQALLRGEEVRGTPKLQGDGSFVLLRAETSLELAASLAALLRTWNEPSAAIVRGGEVPALHNALVAQGLPAIGVTSSSASRPAAQVLPLAIELAFEPRDPYRVLELLTLPISPFEGLVGRELAQALSSAPGIGGPSWKEAKETIAKLSKDDAEAKLARVAEWLETPGVREKAPRSTLLSVSNRVRTWLQARLAYEGEKAPTSASVAALGAAYAQAHAFHEALSLDPREGLDLVAARLLVEQVTGSLKVELSEEQAGRIDPVDTPAGLRVPRDVVVWWHCVSGTEWSPSAVPWRRAEIAALRAAGIALADPVERLTVEAQGWRQAVLAARKRLVLAIPRWARGEALDPHPIWDEIFARLGAKNADVVPITIEARALLEGRAHPLTVETVDLGPLQLPEARAEWKLDGSRLQPAARYSASSLEALVGCPLRWVLTYRAGLRNGSVVSLPKSPMLEGTLGHRLIEGVHVDGGLHAKDLEARIEVNLERLLREEASVLLRVGMTFELAQLRKQLASSVTSLVEMLTASKLKVADVESHVVVAWRGGELEGRLDLLLLDAKGREVILDLKWGGRRYRELLAGGRAVQLAVYAAARRLSTGAKTMPPTGYFSLAGGKLFTLDGTTFAEARAINGPSLDETWDKVERTVERVQQSLSKGRVPVTGVPRSLPLLESLGVLKAHHEQHFDAGAETACEYCSYGALCGRDWQVYS